MYKKLKLKSKYSNISFNVLIINFEEITLKNNIRKI